MYCHGGDGEHDRRVAGHDSLYLRYESKEGAVHLWESLSTSKGSKTWIV